VTRSTGRTTRRRRAGHAPGPGRRVGRTVGLAGAVVMGLAGVAALVASFLGVRTATILTGSMRPVLPPGSLVVTSPLCPDQVRLGEVVAFRPPAPYAEAGNRPVVHRVVAIGTVAGKKVVQTKGDANAAMDPWRITLSTAHFSSVRLHAPVVGRVFAGGRRPIYLMAAGLLALLGLGKFLRRKPVTCTCCAPTVSANTGPGGRHRQTAGRHRRDPRGQLLPH
jgi:signal peptidase